MMPGTWKIRPGSIAAAQYVTAPDGSKYFACGMRYAEPGAAFSFVVEWYPASNMRREVSADIPVNVRECVAQRFAEIFAVPIDARGVALARVQPCTVKQ